MAETTRSFYGGDAPLGNQGGEITAGRYDGPEAHVEAPWKCPACAKENEGPLKFGCVHCGSGQPGTHVGVQQPPPPARKFAPGIDQEHEQLIDHALAYSPHTHPIYAIAESWAEAHAASSIAEAFVAGYLAARAAPVAPPPAPVSTDVDQLAPAGKPRRTIVAALEIFRDQILPVSAEEIASGEWCSVAEIEQLIAQLQGEDVG